MLPLWLEVVLLTLAAYATGLGIGWVRWARRHDDTARTRTGGDDGHD